MENEKREKALDRVKEVLSWMYGAEISKWISESWIALETWHFKLAGYLRESILDNKIEILTLSLLLLPLDAFHLGTFSKYAC